VLKAASRTLAQLLDPALFGIVLVSVFATALTLAVCWFGLGALLAHFTFSQTRWLDWLARAAIGVGALFGTLALFGPISAMIAGLFIDRIARAVERRYYPWLPPPRRQSPFEQVRAGLSFLIAAIGVNLLALPLYLIWGLDVPIVNGYLLGREYFELVASRYNDRAGVARLRRRHGPRLLLAGVMIAGLSFLPFANLLTPVIATAFMLHILQTLSGADRGLPPLAVR